MPSELVKAQRATVQSWQSASTQRTVIVESSTTLSCSDSPPMTAWPSRGSIAAAPTAAPESMAAEEEERQRPSIGSHTLTNPLRQTETSASDRSKAQQASQAISHVWPSRMTRGESRTALPPHTPAAGSTHQRQTCPLSEPVAIAERSRDVTRICLIECFGGVAAVRQRKCSSACGAATERAASAG